MKDHLVKATADGVRIYAAVTTDIVNEAIVIIVIQWQQQPQAGR